MNKKTRNVRKKHRKKIQRMKAKRRALREAASAAPAVGSAAQTPA